MPDSKPEMPLRIWAERDGSVNYWYSPEGPWPMSATQYVRADAEAGMRRIEAIAESERKAEAERERHRAALNIALGALGDIHDGEPEYCTKGELDWCRRRAGEGIASARAALGEGET